MPSNCGAVELRSSTPPGTTRRLYFTSLTDCSANDVPYSQLATDLANNALPAFSFITPNLIDDMHDGTSRPG